MNRNLKIVVNKVNKDENKKLFFERTELKIILDLYAKMVSSGNWKDYGLSISGKQVSFSVFKNAAEKARNAGRAVGSFAKDVEMGLWLKDLGVQYISINTDSTIYMQGCEAIAKALK